VINVGGCCVSAIGQMVLSLDTNIARKQCVSNREGRAPTYLYPGQMSELGRSAIAAVRLHSDLGVASAKIRQVGHTHALPCQTRHVFSVFVLTGRGGYIHAPLPVRYAIRTQCIVLGCVPLYRLRHVSFRLRNVSLVRRPSYVCRCRNPCMRTRPSP
jgi:hypothetical protein